ncbi:MAG: Hpt domain-containing protein [Hyphomicrobiales bacterium]|nr:Hpt domain-containing protein [Hyphomicrobiales bacterium]MDE2017800.1 Hpt domain-containing protein [Hyphomicrobiales bacterium]
MGGPDARPAIDLDALGARAFGDRVLRDDLLRLFLVEAGAVVAAIEAAGAIEPERAHRLRGAALAIGAARVAEAAQAAELAKGGAHAISAAAPLMSACREARDAIEAILTNDV